MSSKLLCRNGAQFVWATLVTQGLVLFNMFGEYSFWKEYNAQVHKFNVEMTCGGCSGAVENVLKKLGNAIEKVEINLDDKTVAVTTSLDYERVLEQIKKTGKETVYLVSE